MIDEQPPHPVNIEILRDSNCADLPLPSYATRHAAGMDLYAAIDTTMILEPGMRELVPTGIRIALPPGYEAQIRPRSGLAWKFGISMVNTPGTIDADYRGEIKVILINLGKEPFTIQRGDRIAQMIVAPVTQVAWHEVATLSESDRGEGGFGHTGGHHTS